MGSRGVVRPGSGADRWFELKSQVHQKLVNSLTPEQLKDLNKDSVRGQIGTVVEKLIIDESLPMTMGERERLIEEILDEVFGLGPLELLLKDPTISDIMVNGFDNVYVERAGRVVETNIRFKDHAHVRMIIERIVSAIGPPHRRFVADCGRAPGRRLARLRGDSAALADRAGDVDPPLRQEGAHHRGPAQERDLHHRHAGFHERLRGSAAEHRDLGRFGLGQDHDAEHALALHPGGRAHRHHRRHGRAAICSRGTWCGWKRARRTSKARAPSRSATW